MAGTFFTAVASDQAIGTSTETLLQVTAGTNNPLTVHRFGVSFKGTSATGQPVLVEVLRQTTAGTASSVTPRETTDTSQTIQATAQDTYTSEPTSGDILYRELVHPQGGWHERLLPGELVVAGGGRIAIRTNNTGGTDVNAVASLLCEE